MPNPRHGSVFVRGDIGDRVLVRQLLREHQVTAVVNFALYDPQGPGLAAFFAAALI